MYTTAMSMCTHLSSLVNTDFCICIVLHPQFKLQWFKAKQCDQEWLDKAVTNVRRIWERDHLPNVMARNAAQSVSVVHITQLPELISYQISFNIESYRHLRTAPQADAFTRYLSEPTFNTSDPLMYWRAQEQIGVIEHSSLGWRKIIFPHQVCNCVLFRCQYPDAAIATSVNVNHAFALNNAYHREHKTLPDAYRCKTAILDSWLKFPGLLTEAEFAERWKKETEDSVAKAKA